LFILVVLQGVGLHAEAGSEVKFACFFVIYKLFGRAIHKNLPFRHNIGSIHDLQGLADLVVGDQNTKAACSQSA